MTALIVYQPCIDNQCLLFSSSEFIRVVTDSINIRIMYFAVSSQIYFLLFFQSYYYINSSGKVGVKIE